MAWIDDLNNLPDVGMVQQFQPVVQQPKQEQKKKKNLLAALLPAAGGTGGAAAGAAIGTAIFPGVGTLIGAGLGGALGSGLGKVGENAVNDESLTKGVAGEAALGGIFGAGPLRIAKAGIDTARGVKAGAELTQALKGAGESAVNSSIRKTAGEKLTNASNDLVVKDFRLTPTQLNNFKTKFGEDASQVIKRYKLSGKDASAITEQAIKPLQGEFDQIASKIPAIPKENIQRAFQAKYNKLINSAVEDNRAVGQQLKSQADTILKKYGDTVDATELNKLRQEFDGLVSYADKAANPSRYGVNKRAADALRSTIQEAADAVGLKATNGLTFKETGRELQKLRQLTDNVSKQEQLGRGSLPLTLPSLIGAGAGAAGGPAGIVAGGLGTALANSSVGRKALATGVEKTGERLTRSADNLNPYSVTEVAKRVAPATMLAGTPDYLRSSSMAPNDTTTTATNMPITTNMPQQYTNSVNNASYPQAQQIDPTAIQSNVQAILAAGGTLKDAQEYVSLVAALQEVGQAGQTTKPPTSEQQKYMNNALSGLQDIQFLRDSISRDPQVALKTNVPGGSLARSLTGTSEYEAAKNNVMDVIARLRTGAAITKDEQALFARYLPSSFDSPEVANAKLDRLQELFQRFAQPNQVAAPGSLQEALL